MHDQIAAENIDTTNIPRYGSISDVAQRLGLSDKTVRRKVASGELEAVRVGGLIRIKLDSVQKILKPIQPTGR